jgi:uncharacterized protein YbjT (DUF2867 family)
MIDGKSILVVGATGNQGGATASELLAQGWKVRALVRDPGKPEARDLERQGATLVRGDMDDEESLRSAMAGVYGVFSVQALAYEPATLAAEVRQGKAVADAAKASGAEHFVYSSVGGAERRTGIDHFESKAEIERYALSLGLPATILRPDKPMQLIASDDIGFFAATAFNNPQEYIGRQIELAGDKVTFPEVAKIYERVTGVPTRFEALPIEERMFEWFAEEGYEADIPALRRLHPGLMTFEEFLTRRLQAPVG